MFLLKKIVSPFFLPLSFSIVILIMSFIYLQFRQTQRRGRVFVFFGIALLLLSGYNFTANQVLHYLEDQYPPISLEHIRNTQPPVKWIAVLGGGSLAAPNLPPTEQLCEASAARLIEAVRIHRLLPGSRLILSGGTVFNEGGDAQIMAKAAQFFDVKSRDIFIDSKSQDTEEQAVRIREVTGKDRFILVTSAAHMPRAVALFKKAGLDPIPAPAHFLSLRQLDRGNPLAYYPSAEGLRKMETAIHEYLGILWATIQGKI